MNHILVVDDDAAIRELVVDILELSDYRVKTAWNGAVALEEVRAERPCAVLLDLMMPVMDGWEFLRRCRRDARGATLPVAVMSAARDAAAVATELGAQAFLTKPFEMDTVLSIVKRLVNTNPAAGGAPIRG